MPPSAYLHAESKWSAGGKPWLPAGRRNQAARVVTPTLCQACAAGPVLRVGADADRGEGPRAGDGVFLDPSGAGGRAGAGQY